MSAICNHIRQYLDRTGSTMAGLERLSGMATGNLNHIMKAHSTMSPRTFERLAPIVHWTDECRAECQENADRLLRIRRMGRNSAADPARVPWPVTVAKAKAGAHPYATARML